MLEGYSPLIQTLFGTSLTWFVTAVGAALCALHTKNSSAYSHALLLDGSLGFSAGVMLAASFWSLLDPAISMAKDDLDWGSAAVFPVVFGLVLGAAFVASASYFLPVDWLTPVPDSKDKLEKMDEQTVSSSQSRNSPDTYSGSHDRLGVVHRLKKQPSSDGGVPENGEVTGGYRSGFLHDQDAKSSNLVPHFVMNRRLWSLVIAVTVHNIPEGLAVGIAFGGIGQHAQATLANARNLAIGIAIQNFPEGLAVSLPLHAAGCGFIKSFFFGQLSGLVEPMAGILGCIAVQFFRRLQPYALGFAAGAMLFVVFDDIIPEAQHRGNGRWTSVWAVVGFIVMMVLDVLTAVD